MKAARTLPTADKHVSHGRNTAGPTELLVLQATPFCNIDCSYCYLTDRDDQSRMALSVIEKAVDQVLRAQLVKDELTVVWHAGEPLVLGVDYYRLAIERIAQLTPPGITIRHSFQTNGLLIDTRWCEVFKRSDVRLGLSIDGPERFHDRFRKSRSGKGTHRKVSRAVELLRENEVPFHVIAVLTETSIQHPDDLFHYFNALGIDYLCFNVEEIEGRNQTSALLRNDHFSNYINFLRRFHELRYRHDSRLKVREIDGAVSSVMQWRRNESGERLRPQESTPFKIVNVDVNGNFCTFSPELLGMKSERHGDLGMGNVFEGEILDCLRDPHFQGIAGAIADGVSACRGECEYFELCGGGSPSNKLSEHGDFACTETEFCRLQKKACIDVALDILEEGLDIVA